MKWREFIWNYDSSYEIIRMHMKSWEFIRNDIDFILNHDYSCELMIHMKSWESILNHKNPYEIVIIHIKSGLLLWNNDDSYKIIEVHTKYWE